MHCHSCSQMWSLETCWRRTLRSAASDVLGAAGRLRWNKTLQGDARAPESLRTLAHREGRRQRRSASCPQCSSPEGTFLDSCAHTNARRLLHKAPESASPFHLINTSWVTLSHSHPNARIYEATSVLLTPGWNSIPGSEGRNSYHHCPISALRLFLDCFTISKAGLTSILRESVGRQTGFPCYPKSELFLGNVS